MPNDSHKPNATLIECIRRLLPELDELVCRSLVRHHEQSVRLNGTYELGSDPGGWRPGTWDDLPLKHHNPVLEDLLAPIIAGLETHGVDPELIDRARKDIFTYNTFHASFQLIEEDAVMNPFTYSFATRYAPHVRALEIHVLASVSDGDPLTEDQAHTMIEDLVKLIQKLKSPHNKNTGMKMPQVSQLAFVVESRPPPHYGWACNQSHKDAAETKSGGICHFFRPQLRFLATAGELFESLLAKKPLEWDCLKWPIDCSHEHCPLRSSGEYADVSSVKGSKREGKWCSVLVGERTLSVDARKIRALMFVYGSWEAPVNRLAMKALLASLLASHLAVMDDIIRRGGDRGCR